MRIILPSLGLIALTGALRCQDPVPEPDLPSAATTLEALNKEVDEAVKTWREAQRAARAEASSKREPGTPVPAISMQPPLKSFVAKFQAAATQHADSDDAIPFLTWLVQTGGQFDKDAAIEALDTLGESHGQSALIADLMPMIGYLPRMLGKEPAERFRAAVSTNEHPDVRGWLMLEAHGETIDKSDVGSEAYVHARSELLGIVPKLSSKRLASEIRGKIDLREKYGPGNVAPDIAGVDIDGVEFKLSDYKGKVVFLDFWGDW